MTRRYYIWTIGCQMNTADSRAVAQGLERRGFLPASSPDQADVIVLNTCVVRESAEQRARGRLSSLRSVKQRRPDSILAVMGCLVGDNEAELRRQYPFVDLFLRPSHPEPLFAALDAVGCGTQFAAPVSPAPVSAYLPISYGCDHFCTYCIVRLRRGPQQSRPMEDIYRDALELVERGAREMILLGQNVDAYGTDLPGGPNLAGLLEKLHDIPGLWRLRFLTSHPADMQERLIETVAELPKVCEHFELPVQSGSDAVLRRMGRRYTAAQYLELIERIRARVPDAGLATDVIVGFCGETVEDFQATRRLLERVRFDVVHIAPYSVRPGTPAERLPDDVPFEVKEQRRQELEKLQERIAGEINAALVGKSVEVLVEDRHKGRWHGRTRQNKLIFFDSEQELAGTLVDVRITWAGPWSLIGELERIKARTP
ncbi:MAG: tRNA (N6-isopentenyl adenosine(37)-C2)-methylthiotransferase MiaB [Anaerolineae bacterium]